MNHLIVFLELDNKKKLVPVSFFFYVQSFYEKRKILLYKIVIIVVTVTISLRSKKD